MEFGYGAGVVVAAPSFYLRLTVAVPRPRRI